MQEDNYVLKIANFHGESCGKSPNIEVDSDCYFGYFLNHSNEQWVFAYDYKTQTGTVRGGDGGWQNEITINPDGSGLSMLAFSPPEREWLSLCWSTVQMRKGSEAVPLKFFDYGLLIQEALEEARKAEKTQ